MTNSLEDEVRRVLAGMDNQNSQEQETELPGSTEQDIEPAETIHIHYFPDAIVILKEGEETPQVVDSTPVIPQKISVIPAHAICGFYLFLILSTLAFQVYELLNPPIATVTIIPKSQTVTLNGTLRLGKLLNPTTISQSATTPTTGKGHQDARAATGYLTFYNGQFQSVTIAAGTILQGSSGVQIVTDQDATTPAGNPPSYGQVTVSAHAMYAGSKGNIAAYDINQGCCATAIKVVNTNSFYGGVDERDFQTVTKADITKAATPLKSTVLQSMTGALQGQLKTNEQLYILPCTPTVTSDHLIGAEATQVKVSVSETCSSIAFNRGELDRKATDLLNRQAATNIGTGYSLFGEVQVTVTQATIIHTTPPVFLSFHAQGIWVYGLSQKAQEHIKELIAGKSKDQALQIIASMPGIEKGSISWGDDTRLPKDSSSIHVVMLINSV